MLGAPLPCEDRLALEDLHARYVHAVDRGDFDLLRALYTDDAVEEHGPFLGPVDAFIAWLRPVCAAFEIATHTVTNLLARGDAATAQSEARGVAFLRLKGDPPFGVLVVNRLFDSYRKVDGQWLFARRAVCVDWAEQFAGRVGPLGLTEGFAPGAGDASDLLYARVSGLVAALRPAAAGEG